MKSPPKHLSVEAKTFWRRVVKEYALEDHHGRLLRHACESLDLAEQARAALAKAGSLVFEDSRGNLKARPEATILHNAQLRFARIIAQLGFDLEATRPTPGRPPAGNIADY